MKATMIAANAAIADDVYNDSEVYTRPSDNYATDILLMVLGTLQPSISQETVYNITLFIMSSLMTAGICCPQFTGWGTGDHCPRRALEECNHIRFGLNLAVLETVARPYPEGSFSEESFQGVGGRRVRGSPGVRKSKGGVQLEVERRTSVLLGRGGLGHGWRDQWEARLLGVSTYRRIGSVFRMFMVNALGGSNEEGREAGR